MAKYHSEIIYAIEVFMSKLLAFRSCYFEMDTYLDLSNLVFLNSGYRIL